MNEVRKFVDNCIKTKDGIRFRKRYPAPTKLEMTAAGTGVNNNGDTFAEYGELEGGPLDSVLIEVLSSGSTTPLPGKGAVRQQFKSVRTSNELAAQRPQSAPLLSPQMVNEKQQQLQPLLNNGGPPSLLQMMRAYLTDLARQRLLMQKQQQQRENNQFEWNQARQLLA